MDAVRDIPGTIQRPPNLRLLDRLSAEHETAWGQDVFLPPPDFNELATMRSVILVGESGSGKTATRMALERFCQTETAPPACLVVSWQPSLPGEAYSPSQRVQDWFEQIFYACAQSLLAFIGRWPERFIRAKNWAQTLLVSFIHQYLKSDYFLIAGQLEEGCSPEGIELIQRRLTVAPPHTFFGPETPLPRAITQLKKATEELGLEGVWVMVDSFEAWIDAQSELIQSALQALLSSLAVFEESGFVLKIVAPVELEAQIACSSGVERRRLEVHHLQWTGEQLQAIASRWLALALGKPADFCLSDLCVSADLLPWLEKYGGGLPRGWLELLRPLAAAYLENASPRPLTDEEFQRVTRQHPPRLRVDANRQRVYLGYGEVADIQPTSYRMLEYLYQNRARLCSREELYYLGCEGLKAIPTSTADPNYKYPKEIGGVIDTVLWRIRQALEPDPHEPIYIITQRGKGAGLKNSW